VLTINGKIHCGATTGATTYYSDARNLRYILCGTCGAVCNQPFQKDSLVSRERPVFGSTVVVGFFHEAMIVGFFVNCRKIAISLIDHSRPMHQNIFATITVELFPVMGVQ
jgi:hypothetical protein